MKILKNKTYKNLLLKIEVLESDKERLIKKCDFQQMDFNGLSGRFELQRDEIKSLIDKNIKLQKKCDEIQNEFNLSEQRSRIKFDNLNEKLNDSREQNILLADERDELQSKLSRKGLGKKGRKKDDVVEQQKYVEITSSEQLKKYDGFKFEADINSTKINGIVKIREYIVWLPAPILYFNSDDIGWENQDEKSEYKKCWAVFDGNFGKQIKSLKVLL